MRKAGLKKAATVIAVALVMIMAVSPAYAASNVDADSTILCTCSREYDSNGSRIIRYLMERLSIFSQKRIEDTDDSHTEVEPDETDTILSNPSEEDTQENEYISKVLALVNSARRENGLSELRLDKNLCEAAAIRAKEQNESFGHTRPDGSSYYSVLEQSSYRITGENVAIGQTSPEQVFNDWMNSPGHRGNILSSNYASIGIGVAKCTVSGYTGFCWSQLFAG